MLPIFKELIEKYSLFFNIALYRDNWKEKATFYKKSAFGDKIHALVLIEYLRHMKSLSLKGVYWSYPALVDSVEVSYDQSSFASPSTHR